MFNKTNYNYTSISEKAAKKLAKGQKKSAKIQARAERDAAERDASAREYAAKQERIARETEAEWRFAQENPEEYAAMKQAEKENETKQLELKMAFVERVASKGVKAGVKAGKSLKAPLIKFVKIAISLFLTIVAIACLNEFLKPRGGVAEISFFLVCVFLIICVWYSKLKQLFSGKKVDDQQ